MRRVAVDDVNDVYYTSTWQEGALVACWKKVILVFVKICVVRCNFSLRILKSQIISFFPGTCLLRLISALPCSYLIIARLPGESQD